METVDTTPHQPSRLLDFLSANLGRLALIFADCLDFETRKMLRPLAPKSRRWAPAIALSFSPFFMALSGGLCPQSVSAAPAYVQGAYATPQTPQTTVSVPYAAAQNAGNLNVVIVGWNDTTNAVTSVKDSQGNVYQVAVGPTKQSTALSQSIYYAKSILGGSNTVTVQFSGSASYPDIRVLEYSGLDTSNPLDTTNGASGGGSTSSTGAITTTSASELLVAANMVTNNTNGAGSGFTRRIITSPDGDLVEDKIVTAIGSYSATAPLNSGGWVMQIATFR
ncbi:MAG TPA: hypothetical protein VN957_18985, partial [Chthoniobacterales bacterium]|nr:hypothetical protein [Chthoniobacterales bacterium]